MTGDLELVCSRWHIYAHSVQSSRSVVSDSLRLHGQQHARPPCPSPAPGVYRNSCPLSRCTHTHTHIYMSVCLSPASVFLGSSVVKNLSADAGDVGLIPGLERSPGEGNGEPLLYPCLGNAMDRGAWRATVHAVTKSRTRLRD